MAQNRDFYIIQEFKFKDTLIRLKIQLYNIRMKMEALEPHSKLLQIQSRLTKLAYLSKQALPGAADALIFQKLKNYQKIPTKQRYFNFYHWYITMSQFAQKEVDRWVKDKESLEQDKLILECLALLQTFKSSAQNKSPDILIDYLMNVSLKQPSESNLTVVKNRFLTLNPEQIGQELKILFKNYQERINQSSQNANQLRIMFRLRQTGCQKLKDIVSKWPEVKNIQIKKQKREKRL